MSEQIFPSWRYHKTKQPVCVKSAEELAALGNEWAVSPAFFDKQSKVSDSTPAGSTSDYKAKIDEQQGSEPQPEKKPKKS